MNLMVISLLKTGIRKSSIVLLLFSTVSTAADIQLTWSTANDREDGTPIQEIEKYNLYYTLNNVLQDVIEVDALANTYLIQNISTGNHTIQISTVEAGIEGDLSDPVTVSTSTSKPVKILLTVEIIE